MIAFVIGTSAEALKLKHVFVECRKNKVKFRVVSLGQHGIDLENILSQECTKEEVIFLRKNDENLLNVKEAALWSVMSVYKLMRILKLPKRFSCLVVQGDTLSTLIGAFCGRAKRLRVVHIEAGLRSGSLFDPFPEEMTRRLVTKLSTFHIAPGEYEASVLASEGIKPTNIKHSAGNTGLDNISKSFHKAEHPDPYAIVTLHRTEILRRQDKLKEIFYELSRISHDIKIFCYLDTRAILAYKSLDITNSQMEIGPRIEHEDFIKSIRNADWVLTDSGGLQEECAYLGIPTFVHRRSTERFEGINENVFLSEWNIEPLEGFLQNYKNYRLEPRILEISPSWIVVKCIKDWELE
jgi:UDP-N-acetylglucosamine 2-epimerase (non-hydrolysing)